MRKPKSKKSTNVVPFPRDGARSSKPAAVTVGHVVAVPPARHRRILAYVVAQMRKQPTVDAAEDVLVDHLNLEWGRLEWLGIADTEADQLCLEFARAAWRAALPGQTWEGVA